VEYRAAFAVVFQENYVFKGSLASNIAMSDGPFDAQKLQAAAERTGFAKVVQGLSNGFMAETSERGETLSGGQRRLLALTRAVYQDFTHLLLDEPSSGLDAITERDLLQALASGLGGKTLLFTTHRPAPIGLASKLIVIEAGRVQNFGDRDAVLQALRADNPA
jgi:ABC-type transport system involved in cytochrome bd biosynthesis fused ATPase/permease subunit